MECKSVLLISSDSPQGIKVNLHIKLVGLFPCTNGSATYRYKFRGGLVWNTQPCNKFKLHIDVRVLQGGNHFGKKLVATLYVVSWKILL